MRRRKKREEEAHSTAPSGASALRPLSLIMRALVHELRLLHRPEGRAAARAVLVEGRRLIDGLVCGGWQPQILVIPEHVSHASIPRTWLGASDTAPVVVHATPELAGRLTQHRSPSGWFARFAMPARRSVASLDPRQPALVLVGLADPGNVGTLLRTAVALGTRQAVMVAGADVFNAKAMQAGAGAHASLALAHAADAAELAAVQAHLVACIARGGAEPPAGDRDNKVRSAGRVPWLVLGSEATGLDADWVRVCAERWSIEMARAGGMDSLNVAAAGAICMWAARARG